MRHAFIHGLIYHQSIAYSYVTCYLHIKSCIRLVQCSYGLMVLAHRNWYTFFSLSFGGMFAFVYVSYSRRWRRCCILMKIESFSSMSLILVQKWMVICYPIAIYGCIGCFDTASLSFVDDDVCLFVFAIWVVSVMYCQRNEYLFDYTWLLLHTNRITTYVVCIANQELVWSVRVVEINTDEAKQRKKNYRTLYKQHWRGCFDVIRGGGHMFANMNNENLF